MTIKARKRKEIFTGRGWLPSLYWGERERERERERAIIRGSGPKQWTSYDSDESEENYDSKGEKRDKGICLHIWVSVLVDFDENNSSSDKHEGCVCRKGNY